MLNNFYYKIKPFIPRSLQIWMRRVIIRQKLKKYAHIWPIDEKAGIPPEGWSGWPEGKKFAFVLSHDVETGEGQQKCRQLAEIEMDLGFRSSFNFVAEDYKVDRELQHFLVENGFEIGIHGLNHKGNMFSSPKRFFYEAPKINYYLREWNAVGFRAPSMYRNFELLHFLDILYDSSAFDTDPFEPQPDGVGTIFPFFVPRRSSSPFAMRSAPSNLLSSTPCFELPAPRSNDSSLKTQHLKIDSFSCSTAALNDGSTAALNNSHCAMRSALCSMPKIGYYVELPYTLPQDHTLFIVMQEKDISIWKKKLNWIAKTGGMALLNVHPDYLRFDSKRNTKLTYPHELYKEFLATVTIGTFLVS